MSSLNKVKNTPGWLLADWPVPAHIHAGTTTRRGGLSRPPYNSLNLGLHVDDDPSAVMANRAALEQELGLPAGPIWLDQVHGVEAVDASQQTDVVQADASYTRQTGVVCAVMTADCLPVLFCDEAGSLVAAAHAGWRGLAAGVLEQTMLKAGFIPEQTLVWLGPGIGAESYEIGDEVRDVFISQAMHDDSAFKPSPQGRWLIDMYLLARQRLTNLNVTRIYGGQYCTYQQQEQFYSYRRDGITGRMASLIWMDKQG